MPPVNGTPACRFGNGNAAATATAAATAARHPRATATRAISRRRRRVGVHTRSEVDMARSGIARSTTPRTIGRIALAAALVFAGVSHLFWARKEFRAQVPSWVPMDADAVVVASGVVEIGLG